MLRLWLTILLVCQSSQTDAAPSPALPLPELNRGRPLGDGRWTLAVPPEFKPSIPDTDEYVQTYNVDLSYAASCPTTAPKPMHRDDQAAPWEIDYETKAGELDKPIETSVSFKVNIFDKTVTVEGWGTLAIDRIATRATIWPKVDIDIIVKAKCALELYGECCEGYLDVSVGFHVDETYVIDKPKFKFQQTCSPIYMGIPGACDAARAKIPGLPTAEECDVAAQMWIPSAPPMPDDDQPGPWGVHRRQRGASEESALVPIKIV
ncbi:uncharacterized protein L969DRAFT_16170 [Mixia osmundae IAM 14324]|nr:uncharacterized protein L969DRAFT_16170 [Mixia osmundae IAM 14324]KEI40810.1 hypothetical protein L969DRAFT_16170 [Mixia osmundae IAM 14324]